ncbi:MAG: hypothetical protein IT162_03480 [Bryobacterales bacterium]|nr:hypothetical protein [Bryobacterales bacterium]
MSCFARHGSALVMALFLWGGPGAAGLYGQSGYGGPNILSRSSNYIGRGQSVGPIKLRYQLNANYFHSNGLIGVSDSNTQSFTAGAMNGVSIGGGLWGTKVSRRSQTTFGYHGMYAHSKSFSAINGSDQQMTLQHERTLTRRWGLYTGHSAGAQSTVLRSRTLIAQDQFRSPFDQTYVNYNEPLDSKLYYLNSNAGLFYQASQRMVVSMDGGLFTVRRVNGPLASVRGERAQGEISYRLNARSSVSLFYNYNHFFFLRSFGESYVHTFQASYARRFSRTWAGYVRGGMFRAESERLRSVAVDPFIASLTGQVATIEAFHGIQRGVTAGAGLTATGRHHGLTISYDRSVNPGNGLSLTALGQTFTSYYNYTARRNLTAGGGFFSSQLTPLLQGLDNSTVVGGRVRQGQFRSYGVGGGLAYRITSVLFATLNTEVMRLQYNANAFNATGRTLSIGLAYSPGETPLRWR